MKIYCAKCNHVFSAEVPADGDSVPCPKCGAPVKFPENKLGPGTVIGDFVIERALSKGGMGEVFLAKQISLDRPVALKVLQDKFLDDKEYVDSLFREARAAGKISHPNIVQAYAVGEEDGIFYFAMEFIRGETLKQILKREKKLEFTMAARIIREIAGALDAAWREQKLVHQDIKPDNIMLDGNGFAKLADLGLARVASTDQDEEVGDEVMGTPQYISPEQLTGIPTDVRSDIYSLGATFYQFVTGRFPYVADTAEEIAKAFPNIHVRYVNSILEPKLFEKYKYTDVSTIKTTSVIVESGSEFRVYAADAFFVTDSNTSNVWAYNGEEIFAAAFLAVTAAETPLACFTTGHGESVDAAFINTIVKAGYEARTIDLTKEDIPDDCRLIIVNDPRYDLAGYNIYDKDAVSEIAKIDKLLDSNGTLMVFKDPDTAYLKNLEEYLYEWGVVFSDGVVVDNSDSITSDGQSLVATYPSGTLASSIHKDISSLSSPPKTIVKYASPITVSDLFTAGREDQHLDLLGQHRLPRALRRADRRQDRRGGGGRSGHRPHGRLQPHDRHTRDEHGKQRHLLRLRSRGGHTLLHLARLSRIQCLRQREHSLLRAARDGQRKSPRRHPVQGICQHQDRGHDQRRGDPRSNPSDHGDPADHSGGRHRCHHEEKV